MFIENNQINILYFTNDGFLLNCIGFEIVLDLEFDLDFQTALDFRIALGFLGFLIALDYLGFRITLGFLIALDYLGFPITLGFDIINCDALHDGALHALRDDDVILSLDRYTIVAGLEIDFVLGIVLDPDFHILVD